MNSQRFGSRVIFSLLLCTVLLISLQGEVLAKQKTIGITENTQGELFAIDVALSSGKVLDEFGIIYQDQPRLGYWRAAATIQQLYVLQERGVGFTYAGQVSIVEGGEDQPNRSSSTGFCNGVNGTNYYFPSENSWFYSPLLTNCPGSGTATVAYIDVYYDVVHGWAENAVDLRLYSSSPTWEYQELETVPDGTPCVAPTTGDYHNYYYNITKFNGRPVNQNWNLAAYDYCTWFGSPPGGYIDYWSIWVYYASTTPLVEPSYVGPDITISSNWSGEYSPAIAYNSLHDEYLVVWENDWGGGYRDLYAQRVSNSGKLLSWFSVTVDNSHSKANPSVAFDRVNDRYLVVFSYDVWGDGRDWDIYGRYIPWNGPDSAMHEFAICVWTSQELHPVVSYGFSALSYLVAWTSDPSSGATYISGRILFADSSAMGDEFTISAGTGDRDSVDVTYNLARNEFLAVWGVNSPSDIYGLRLRGDGVPLGSGEFSIAGWPSDENLPSVAACDQADQYLVAWQSDQSTGLDQHAIYARFLNGDAKLGAVNLMENFSNDEKHVDISCNASGNQYLLSWQYQYFGSDYGIWGAIAYPNGLISTPFEITCPGLVEDREYPAIGGGKSSYLVAWEHQRYGDMNLDIHGRLLRYASFLPITIR